jgi:hypothetical protein
LNLKVKNLKLLSIFLATHLGTSFRNPMTSTKNNSKRKKMQTLVPSNYILKKTKKKPLFIASLQK